MKVKKYDQWLIVSVILLLLFVTFLVWPLFGLLKQSVFNSAGEFSLANFERFFTYVNGYYLKPIWNPVKRPRSFRNPPLTASLSPVPRSS